ncbi:hypothetical protein CCACVL1_02872 [Corchorus capsularis]|uniref:Uncharacterized protein n=1 Tax=Corchorus capsularis TaxID=210143 RepID=A0A1R3K539_COCAP|nr:hypothetical protein CCACVL1_02872 [Corchorus capsularis]
MTTVRKMGEYESSCWYDDQVSFMQDIESPRRIPHQPYASYHHHYPCKQELELQYNLPHHDPFLQLPQLESPKVPQSAASVSCNSVVPNYGYDRNNNGSTLQSSTLTQEQNLNSLYNNNNSEQAVDQVTTDWRVLDKFVASQLSHEEALKENNYHNAATSSFHVGEEMNLVLAANESKRAPESVAHQEYASTSTSSCQIDLWK